MKHHLLALLLVGMLPFAKAQKRPNQNTPVAETATTSTPSVFTDLNSYFKPVKWRNIGPFRGGRSVAVSGVMDNPQLYYMGTTGGGLWKTEDAGWTWQNISDGFFKTGSVGAVAVSESDPSIVYVGMGEHAPRGVMTSYGDGVYKSTDAGKTWRKMGLDLSRQIAAICIHPQMPDVVYVAAQGAIYGATTDRGIYKSMDGGVTWRKILYVDENTGCNDLSMDMTNPRILYASLWDYRRSPWEIRSGGKGSGLYKSTDGGETWTRLEKGLPTELGKMSISVSRANPNRVYALIESDTKTEKGGVFLSDDAGKSWQRVSKDHNLTQRAWYYIEIFADPQNENTVYIHNVGFWKSIDGGKTWTRITGSHGDHHGLWINPKNNQNMVQANDGGGAISFNGGKTWSYQNNQPTAQFYRVNADNRFPYRVYGGQQDNTSVMIASRNPSSGGISEKDWSASAGGESAFLAFDPNNPRYVMGGSYQGTVEILDQETLEGKSVMETPKLYLAMQPKDMAYRFNWNAPIIYSRQEPNAFFHAGNVLFKTSDMGRTWMKVSPDLTRHDTAKMRTSGVPYTNEGAGGENYGTISYVAEPLNEKGTLWVGTDDGLVQITRDGGANWANITPPNLPECLVNCIEISPFDGGTAYIATTRYKFNDLTPSVWKTTDYGKTWTNISKGLPDGAFTRVVREDTERKGLLYCGTELGFFLSYDGGATWHPFQSNLPIVPITDLKVHQNDLIAATAGRAFWILDDLAVIRAFDDKTALGTPRQDVLLFKPEDTYRVSGSSSLDRVTDEDENTNLVAGRNGFTGTNPASGVVIYYQLPENLDANTSVTLDILEENGQLIRRFAPRYADRFSPETKLLTRKGLNRFVWDMRYPLLPRIDGVFIEGDLTGRKVPPGNYVAKLKVGTGEKTVSFRILTDPRLNTPPSDFAEQQKILARTEGAVREIHGAVLQLRSARRQVNDLAELLGNKADVKEVVEEGKKLVTKITALEESLLQTKSQSNDDVINFENKLSANYLFLKGEMEGNIPYVTAAQRQRLVELDAEWSILRGRFESVLRDIDEFNLRCSEAKINKITLPILPAGGG